MSRGGQREQWDTTEPELILILSDLSDAMTVNHPISDVGPLIQSLSQDLSMVNQIRTMIFEIMASERSLTQQRVQDKVLEMMSLSWEMLDNSTAVTSMATSMSSLLVSWLPSSSRHQHRQKNSDFTFSGNVTSWVGQVLTHSCKESTDSAEQNLYLHHLQLEIVCISGMHWFQITDSTLQIKRSSCDLLESSWIKTVRASIFSMSGRVVLDQHKVLNKSSGSGWRDKRVFIKKLDIFLAALLVKQPTALK